MNVVRSSSRKPVTLGRELYRGGEGAIHEVVGQAGLVAKVFLPAPREGYDAKLAWMHAHPPSVSGNANGHASIAWPIDLLSGKRGEFIGYLMPYIQGAVPMLCVFNPGRRAKVLPSFNWKYLHRTARNLAASLAALHERDYVVGDLNESNILVMPTALITMIDTDSFQVKEHRQSQIVFYPCPVGKPEYTAPELQGKSFQGELRQSYHDCFALAVLVFQLLMGGSHPFRGRWLGSGEPPPLEEKIRQGWFPYLAEAGGKVAPPRHVLSLDSLHPDMRDLMVRCFVEGQHNPLRRPSAHEWVEALGRAEHDLVECRNGHFFARHSGECPWCVLERNSVRAPRHSARRSATNNTLRSRGSLRGTPPTSGAATRVSTVVMCPRCGWQNKIDDIYCDNCAHQLCGSRICPYCGGIIPEKARFCIFCRHKV